MRFARLRVGGLLDRYVGGLFLASYATAVLLIVGLVVILSLTSNLDYFEPGPDGQRTPTWTIVRYYVLHVPFLYLQVAPFVTVVAGMFTLSRLLKFNETVAGLAAGVSMQRLLAPVFFGGAAVALFMFTLRESATAALGPKRDSLLDQIENHRVERVFESVWFRDLYGSVVRLAEFRPATGAPPVAEIRGLEATIKKGGEVSLIRADRARYVLREGRPAWALEGGVLEVVRGDTERREIAYLERISFSPEDVLVALKAQERALELSFAELGDLARRDPDNKEYQTLLQYHLTFPLANLVLLLIALPFMVRHERGAGIEGLVAGCLLCMFYFAFDFVTRSLGMDGDLSPLFASWLPVLLFGSIGVVLFEGMRS